MVSSRIKSLDGIRFILALLVVTGHFYTFIGGVTFHKFSPVIQGILWSPIKAVFGFMVITGFLMMHNYLIREGKEPANSKSTFVKFWLRRFFRLYPLYILLIIIAFFTFTYTAGLAEKNLIFFTGSNLTQWGTIRTTAQPGVLDLISHIFLIHGVFPQFHDSILGVTWSLSLEMQFYFIFPFLFLFLLKNKALSKTRLSVLLVVCSFIAAHALEPVGAVLRHYHLPGFREPSFLIFTMPVFLLGMIMAGVKHEKIDVGYLLISLFLVATTQTFFTNLIIGCLTIFMFLDELEAYLPKFIFKPLLVINNALSGKIAEFGANISYSLYLIHTIIISCILNIVITNNHLFNFSKNQIIIVSFVLTIAICFCLCALLYRFIEQPFITIGRNVINKLKAKGTKNKEAQSVGV